MKQTFAVFEVGPSHRQCTVHYAGCSPFCSGVRIISSYHHIMNTLQGTVSESIGTHFKQLLLSDACPDDGLLVFVFLMQRDKQATLNTEEIRVPHPVNVYVF